MLAGVAAVAVLCGGVSVMGTSADTCPYDCDVNQDGTVNILDNIMLNQYLGGRFYVSDLSVMDVDGNYVINTIDAICVLTHTVGVTCTWEYIDVPEVTEG